MQAIKNAAISAQILSLIEEGHNVRAAIDAVLGAGTASQIVSELYDALRAKAGA